jgi:DNA-binding NtrC family response regulator
VTRILIVEDDNNKRLQLLQLLKDQLPASEIVLSRSLQSGIRVLRTDILQLVILDMTLPNFDPGPDESGGSTHAFGGRDFLDQMERFQIVTPVIVVTQFESFGVGSELMSIQQLDAQLKKEYGEVYRGIVYYHAAIQGWKNDLSELIGRSLAAE